MSIRKGHSSIGVGQPSAPRRRSTSRPTAGVGTVSSPVNRMNQEELQKQLEILLNDQRQITAGRRIAGIKTTNTVTTTYKDVQSGSGINPIFVDFKKGAKVTSDLIEALRKPSVNVEQAKRTVAGYKQKYQAYKKRGGTMSHNSWLIDKGYASRDGAKNCCLM